MGVFKAVKLELQVLANEGESDDQISEMITDAMHDYCDFHACQVKIVEVHRSIAAPPSDEMPEA